MYTQSVQDYLKAIYRLQSDSQASTSDIAKLLNLSAASVTGMLKRLTEMGLVSHESYKGTRLTEKGRKTALQILRQHRLLELFLSQELGYDIDEVHQEAENLEHHISERFTARIDAKLGFPEFDPHGHPIPSADGQVPSQTGIQLSEITSPGTFVIQRIPDDDPAFLRHLSNEGLLPGTRFDWLSRAPFEGPITIGWDNREKIVGYRIASRIMVERVDRTGLNHK